MNLSEAPGLALPGFVQIEREDRSVVARWFGEARRLAGESDEPPEICRGCALYRGAF